MVVSSSLQFCNQLQIGSNYSCIRRPKSSTGKVHLCFPSNQLDAWNLYLLSKVKGPISSATFKCKRLACRAVLPSGGTDFPAVQKAVLLLKRVSHNLSGSQFALQLGPAIGIITFALWGLRPLVRVFRNSIFQESDSNWKKSDTHYITTSYIQPFMIWLGTMLVCRALEPLILPTEASRAIKQRLLYFVRSLSSVMAFAYCLSSLIQQLQKFFVETSDSSAARNMGYQFAGKAISMAVWVAAVSLFMELLGFSTQKWLTAGGLGTVLLTLAGREILTNFLSSMMIHTTRPFVLTEWIQTKIEGYEVSGTVEHVGWWSPTIIRGDDREAVHIPNHKFTVNVVRNLSQKTHWRIKTYFAISHLDVSKINYIVADMRKVIAKNPQVEQQKLHRRVFLENVDPENQALMIMVSCFVKTPHIQEYLCVKEAVILDLLRVISHHRARLATPIRSIQKVYTGSDIDNVPYTHRQDLASRALLVDSSYKAVSSNKPKSSSTKSSVADEAAVDSNKPDPGIDAKPSITIPAKADETTSDAEMSDSKAGPGDTTAAASDKTPSTPLDTFKETASKQESEKSPVQPARPMLEDNLVLGVALEGSKRTLPIEGMTSSEMESKEPAPQRDGSGSFPPSSKDGSSDDKKQSNPDVNPGEKES